MRLPIDWIKEHVAVEASADEIAVRLTMAGLEVEEKAQSAIGPVLDIKVTPNRGDCLSVHGVARELRASYGLEDSAAGAGTRSELSSENADPSARALQAVSASSDENVNGSLSGLVTIEAEDLCPRYAARIVKNLRVGTSPTWMQDRLAAAGMRSINNIVDITNYVMLETGQPLHAFDYDLLQENRVVIRRAEAGEKLTTLDGVERDLTPGQLVIADAERVVALAGVMGGLETELTERTKTMLLESAHFEPLAVRRTARDLGMRTEASYRFERHVDPAGVAAAADRACELIAELEAGDVVEGVVDVLARPIEARKLLLRLDRVSQMLGYDVEPDEVIASLGALGFEPDWTYHTPFSTAVEFSIPSWRPDVVREIDLVEEVGRVLGYERIPETLPAGRSLQGADSAQSALADRLRSILAGSGLQEVVTHTLIAASPLEEGAASQPRVAIRSALSADLSGLRRSLIPGLVDTLERNARRGLTPLAFFEVGRIFRADQSSYIEEPAVAGVVAGTLGLVNWNKESSAAAADFFTARGLVEMLVVGLRFDGLTFAASSDPRFHPGRAAEVFLNGQAIGHVGELHPLHTRDLTTRHRLVAFELILSAIQSAAGARTGFKPLAPYPAVTRDLAPRVAETVSYQSIEKSVEAARVPHLEKCALTDLFSGPPLPNGVKSLTLSLTFRAPDRTLTDDEVSAALDAIRTALERDCGAGFAG